MRKTLAMALVCLGLGLGSTHGQDRGHLTAPPLMSTPEPGGTVVLESAALRVDAAAGAARTTIDMTFRNAGNRVLEGNLQFPLAPGQQVVGFALDVDGRMRDAVPVPKARGRQVFEAIERRGVDPGLLEQTAGESFRLRVFPFAPGGTRRVRVVLLQPLETGPEGSAITLPVAFARELAELPLVVRTAGRASLAGRSRDIAMKREGGAWRTVLRRTDIAGTRPLTLRLDRDAGPRVQAQEHAGERYFLAEVPVAAQPRERVLPRRVGLLWDSSMSGRGRQHDLEFALLDDYFRRLGDAEVDLVRLRDHAESPVRHTVRAGNWSALRADLARTDYDGATAPGGWTPDPAVGEYILFGDGLFNYGDAPFPEFARGQRLYAVSTAETGDFARLRALADARAGRAIALRATRDLGAARRALLDEILRIEAIEGVGVADLLAESYTIDGGAVRVAGRLLDRDGSVRLRLSDGRTLDVPVVDAREGDLAAMLWARYGIEQLQADPLRNRARIAAIGQRFSIVTPETSLIVLEAIEDYVEHGIEPPAELRTAYARLRREAGERRALDVRERLDRIAAQWADRVAWWQKPFPKGPAPRPAVVAAASSAREAANAERRRSAERVMSPPPAPLMAPPPAPAPVAAAAPAADAGTLDMLAVTGSRIREGSAAETDGPVDAAIRLEPWRPDSPAARRLRGAPAAEVYAIYLDERERAPQGTAFYLDAADVLFEKGQPALALRVLSNLAEMELENRHVLRVLGYRLVQARRPDLAIPVLEQVRAMGEEEPQSHRDLGLAYAAAGRRQAAIDALYEVVRGDWDDRFPDIGMTALAELNAIIASAKEPLDTSAIDRRLLRSLPLDLRAVLSWDSDASDMDLWVTDPNGEKAYYGNRLTYQGGRMSRDFTGGYGPEEFALRTAKKGLYRVEANFFGERQALVTGHTTLQLWLSTGFGTTAQKDELVTLRLRDRAETVLVGEFEVK